METAKDELAAVYQDKATGKFWLKCYAIAETQAGGYLMLIRLPLPNTEELISVAITSEYEDEAVAAILRLLDEEKLEKKGFRDLLLEKLEHANMDASDIRFKNRLKRLITLSRLNDPINRREVLGKSKTEVQQDATYFRSIAERATTLLQKLN
ncbi:hypothetical protein ACFSRY_11425 [Pontibacter locisalis]|uniref:Uncharacterized protein n=1 Tax=Pontibacter locisalis TaxID=1719035 RepID=A0ABW5IMK6_9BACT